MASKAAPVPGRLGLPYLGETLAFINNPYRFLEDRQRRHGNVFKSRFLGQDIVFLAGTKGAEAFSATAELRRRAIEAICWNVMGLPPGSESEAITRDYGRVVKGLVSVPLPIPGTPYGQACAARDRVLARIRKVIQERRQRSSTDALSRILAAKSDDGRYFDVCGSGGETLRAYRSHRFRPREALVRVRRICGTRKLDRIFGAVAEQSGSSNLQKSGRI